MEKALPSQRAEEACGHKTFVRSPDEFKILSAFVLAGSGYLDKAVKRKKQEEFMESTVFAFQNEEMLKPEEYAFLRKETRKKASSLTTALSNLEKQIGRSKAQTISQLVNESHNLAKLYPQETVEFQAGKRRLEDLPSEWQLLLERITTEMESEEERTYCNLLIQADIFFSESNRFLRPDEIKETREKLGLTD